MFWRGQPPKQEIDIDWGDRQRLLMILWEATAELKILFDGFQ